MLSKKRPPLLEGPLSLRLESGALLPELRHEELPAMLLPLGSCIVALRTDLEKDAPDLTLDRSLVALVPAGQRYRVRAVSQVTSFLTLLVGDDARKRAVREYRPHVEPALLAEILGRAQTLTRTRWLDEITQRYLFERQVCEKHDSMASRFLETEITKELFFLGKESLDNRTRASVVRGETEIAQRARAWIEENLFSPLRIAELARRVHASESTLLRSFHRELGTTPAAYQRDRRLDEAMLLLRSKRYGVGEVAAQVGYTSLAAFSAAFGRRFRITPSDVRASIGAPNLPPHGEPPRRATPSRRKRKSH